jgi:hypothetical protein
VDFVRAFSSHGFEILTAESVADPRLHADEVSTFSPEFRDNYTLSELAELDLYLAAELGR